MDSRAFAWISQPENHHRAHFVLYTQTIIINITNHSQVRDSQLPAKRPNRQHPAPQRQRLATSSTPVYFSRHPIHETRSRSCAPVALEPR